MTRLRRRLSRQAGFTLAELVVVVAVIGVLIVIAVPVYLGFRDKATDTADASNVRTAQITDAANLAVAP